MMNYFVRKKKFLYTKQILKHLWNHSRVIKSHNNNAVLQRLQNSASFPNQSMFRLDNTRRFLCGDGKGKDDKAACPPCSPQQGGCGTGDGRHDFHPDTEAIMNEQAVEEYGAAFAYLTMALYFGRTDVALPGCQGFFMNMYEEELGHGNIFANYVLMRGGHVKLADIKLPKDLCYTVPKAFKTALQMEKNIKEKLCCVNDVAEKHKDLHVMDLISTEFMEEQNRSICEMARLCTRSKMTDTSVGEHLFDQWIFKSFVKTEDDNLMNKRNLDLEKSKHDIYK